MNIYTTGLLEYAKGLPGDVTVKEAMDKAVEFENRNTDDGALLFGVIGRAYDVGNVLRTARDNARSYTRILNKFKQALLPPNRRYDRDSARLFANNLEFLEAAGWSITDEARETLEEIRLDAGINACVQKGYGLLIKTGEIVKVLGRSDDKKVVIESEGKRQDLNVDAIRSCTALEALSTADE